MYDIKYNHKIPFSLPIKFTVSSNHVFQTNSAICVWGAETTCQLISCENRIFYNNATFIAWPGRTMICDCCAAVVSINESFQALY